MATGGILGLLLHPVALLVMGVSLLVGMAYHKGKVHERNAQARAIVALNKTVITWKRAYEEADAVSEKRLQLALDNWRRTSGGAAIVSASCKLPPAAVIAINNIAGD